MPDVFTLAEMQLLKESKKYSENDVIDYAQRILKWIDNHPGIARRILNNQPISPQLRYKYKKQGIRV